MIEGLSQTRSSLPLATSLAPFKPLHHAGLTPIVNGYGGPFRPLPPGSSTISRIALVNIVGVLEVPEPWIVDLYQWTVVLAYALGHLFLLVAFTIGTSSLDPVDDDDFADYDEDNDDGFETEEVDYEGGPVYDDDFPTSRSVRLGRSATRT